MGRNLALAVASYSPSPKPLDTILLSFYVDLLFWIWASYLTFLCLSFLINKVGTVIFNQLIIYKCDMGAGRAKGLGILSDT